MEPIGKHQTRYVQPTSVRVLVEDEADEPLDVEFRYDCTDPYAVTLVLDGADGPTVWTFARDLLSYGLWESAGDGDVHVFSGELTDRSTVLIELVGDDVEVLLAADRDEVEGFLETSHAMVAPGCETEWLDIDGLLATILAAASQEG